MSSTAGIILCAFYKEDVRAIGYDGGYAEDNGLDQAYGRPAQVAREIGGIGKAFGLFEELGVEKGMLRIGNALNKLSQEGLATANYLSNFTKRVAATARTARASTGDIIGMAAGFAELNLPVERTSSGMERVFKKMGTHLDDFATSVGLSTHVMREAFEENGIEALILFAEALQNATGSTEERIKILDKLGLAGVGASKALESLAHSTEMFREKIVSANKG